MKRIKKILLSLCFIMLIPMLAFHAEAAPTWYAKLISDQMPGDGYSRAVVKDYDGDGVGELIILHTEQYGACDFEIWKSTENGPVCLAEDELYWYGYQSVRVVTYENHNYIVTYSSSGGSGGSYTEYVFYDPLSNYEDSYVLYCSAYESVEYSFAGEKITSEQYSALVKVIQGGSIILRGSDYGTPLKELATHENEYSITTSLTDDIVTVSRGQEFGVFFQLYFRHSLVSAWEEPHYNLSDPTLVEMIDLSWDTQKGWYMTLEGLREGTCEIRIFDASSASEKTVTVTIENGGFSPILDGWALVNNHATFGYDEKYSIDESVYIDLSLQNKYDEDDVWGGNCFGLSLLAIADYLDMIDLAQLFAHNTAFLNTFGYDQELFGKVYDDNGENGHWIRYYSLKHMDNGVEIPYEKAIRLIEWAQVSQHSKKIKNCIVFKGDKDYSMLLDHLNQDNPVPLIIGMDDGAIGASHAVVTDTTQKPIYKGDGWYSIGVYDCNAPRAKNMPETPWDYYTYASSHFEFNVNNGRWRYVYNGKVKYDCMYNFMFTRFVEFYDISSLSSNFFDTQVELAVPDQYMLYSTSKISIHSGNELLFDLDGSPVVHSEKVEYFPYYATDSQPSKSQRGQLLLPEGNYSIESEGPTAVSRKTSRYTTSYSANGDVIVHTQDYGGTFLIYNPSAEPIAFEWTISYPDSRTQVNASGTLDADRSIQILIPQDGQAPQIYTDAEHSKLSTAIIIDDQIYQDPHTSYDDVPEKPAFVDVAAGKFYEIPVLWAVENGITNGIDDTHFGPNELCNRGQVVTFLWRAAGSPEPSSTNNPFTDVSEGKFYYKAVLWAADCGVTTGVDATHFAPNNACTRGQIVTFLYRALG